MRSSIWTAPKALDPHRGQRRGAHWRRGRRIRDAVVNISGGLPLSFSRRWPSRCPISGHQVGETPRPPPRLLSQGSTERHHRDLERPRADPFHPDRLHHRWQTRGIRDPRGLFGEQPGRRYPPGHRQCNGTGAESQHLHRTLSSRHRGGVVVAPTPRASRLPGRGRNRTSASTIDRHGRRHHHHRGVPTTANVMLHRFDPRSAASMLPVTSRAAFPRRCRTPSA